MHPKALKNYKQIETKKMKTEGMNLIIGGITACMDQTSSCEVNFQNPNA